MYLQNIAVLLVLFHVPVKCSKGDRSFPFRNCVKSCKRGCHLNEYPGKLPLYLTIFWWDCLDECKYQCMHNVTATDVKFNYPIKQFYGKWPFVRFLGIQEPASVLFSIFNGVGHIFGWRMLRSAIPNTDYSMFLVWKMNLVVSLNAWFWSAVFHSRDLNWTEKMDYFCATSLVMFSFFACLMRFIGLKNKVRCFCVGLFLLCVYCCHVFYLSVIRFDYGYNMKFNVTIGIINLCSWLSWCFTNYKQQPYVWKCAAMTLSTFCLLALEVIFHPFYGRLTHILYGISEQLHWLIPGTGGGSYLFSCMIRDDLRRVRSFPTLLHFLADDARQELSMKEKSWKFS